MITDYEYAELFSRDKVEKNYIITDGILTVENNRYSVSSHTVLILNEDIMDKLEINENLCDENDLMFGISNSSYITFSVDATMAPLIGKLLKLYLYLDGRPETMFSLGTYRVTSDEPTDDREYRDIEAYDMLYQIINSDVSSWYESLFPTEQSTITLRNMRSSLLNYFDVTDISPVLPNDSLIIHRTMDYSGGGLSGKDMLMFINSISGTFGHINRDGDYISVQLKQNIIGLYPRNDLYPSDTLYPKDDAAFQINDTDYIPPVKYKDWMTEKITKIVIRQDNDDTGVIVGTGENAFILEQNFLLFGKTAEELTTVANNLLAAIGGVYYRPCSFDMFGNPCLEVGDPLRIPGKTCLIYTYMLSRTLKCLPLLEDSVEAKGNLEREDRVNEVSSEITQLKGKTLKLKKDVDGISADVVDLEAQTAAGFNLLSNQISAKVSESGGNPSSFAWLLNSLGFKLQASGETVFDCSANGTIFKSVGNNNAVEITNGTVKQSASNHYTILTNGDFEAYRTSGDDITALLWAGLLNSSGNLKPMILIRDLTTGTGMEIHSDYIEIDDGSESPGIALTSNNWQDYIPNGNGVSY